MLDHAALIAASHPALTREELIDAAREELRHCELRIGAAL